MKTRNSKELGQYIIVDPDICHGQPTFKGTRIMVKSVLEMLVKGWEWDRVSAAYDGRINHAAIAEVLSLEARLSSKRLKNGSGRREYSG